MIDIKTLVDNALIANAEEYKASYYGSLHHGDSMSENGPLWACTYRHEYRAISDTLKRLFPDYEEYITDTMTALRIQTKEEYSKIEEVA